MDEPDADAARTREVLVGLHEVVNVERHGRAWSHGERRAQNRREK